MTHSAVMAVAFYVAAIIFHDPLEAPAQKGTVVPHVLWSEEAVPLLPDLGSWGSPQQLGAWGAGAPLKISATFTFIYCSKTLIFGSKGALVNSPHLKCSTMTMSA